MSLLSQESELNELNANFDKVKGSQEGKGDTGNSGQRKVQETGNTLTFEESGVGPHCARTGGTNG